MTLKYLTSAIMRRARAVETTAHTCYKPKRVAFFELSYNCNFCCPFCYVPWLDYPELYGRPISAKQWLVISNQVIKEGYEGIQLCGGEPSLHPEFANIVTGILDQHPTVPLCVFTNGTCLTDEFLSLVEGRNVSIATSLQGIQTRKEMTGSSVGVSALEKGCRNVRNRRIPFEIQMTITKRYLPELEEMIRFGLGLHPRIMQVNPLVVEGRAKYHPELWLTLKDRKEIDEIVKRANNKTSCEIVVDPELFCIARPDAIAPDGSERPMFPSKCEKCKHDTVFGPDGRRRTCLHAIKTIDG